MTAVETPHRFGLPVRGDSFALVLRSEWTKLRTVRWWMTGLVMIAVVTVMLGLLAATGGGGPCRVRDCELPVGPTGEAVTDHFSLVHRTLHGDGAITVRVTSLVAADQPSSESPGLQPWSKAGLIIKDGTDVGSTYAAVMITGSHGVRLQHDYIHDVAGSPSPSAAASASPGAPRWLRLTRTGSMITADESADGEEWTQVGTVELDGLPEVAEVGMFVAAPDYLLIERAIGGTNSSSGPTLATATFDEAQLDGEVRGAESDWTSTSVGGDDPLGSFEVDGGTFVITGSGDIAPAAGGQAFGAGLPIELTLTGLFAGLIVVAVLATSFVCAEYRRGLIRTTLAATPRRSRVLAAKAAVIGAATFVVGLIAATLAVVLGTRSMRNHGDTVYPTDTLTDVRVVVGTAAMLAVAAVLAVAMGAILRRSAATVTVVIVGVVLPYILSVSSVLPLGPARWLLRVTPAAGFAIQQSLRAYGHVDNEYTPANGYFPLAPWGGFAVLCSWTAVAFAVAVALLHRRDA